VNKGADRASCRDDMVGFTVRQLKYPVNWKIYELSAAFDSSSDTWMSAPQFVRCLLRLD
jgi:hypothetical protein